MLFNLLLTQVKTDYDFLLQINAHVQLGFNPSQNAPFHLDRTSSGPSAFFIASHDQFQSLDTPQLQDMFSRKHIVITDMPNERMTFNRQGLEQLGSWHAPRTIQDLSIPVKDNYAVRQKQGSLKDLLTHANMPNGRVLNALDFKILTAQSPDGRIASDALIWNRTHGMPLFERDYDYPIKEFRWGLAATKGAQHTWHVDADGVATSVQVKTGAKWWVVATPRQGGDCYSLGKHSTAQYDPSLGNLADWRLDAILLQPGMQLYVPFFLLLLSAF
jgi:hypothetical protein